MFAALVADGTYLEIVIDAPDPDAVPPHGDRRRRLVAIGPVANFAASNFPFAFSVPGGDRRAGRGCRVVVKAHSSRAETSRRCAALIAGALDTAGAPREVFAMVEGASVDVGAAFVIAPEITAVHGFPSGWPRALRPCRDTRGAGPRLRGDRQCRPGLRQRGRARCAR
jgi:NADP-dependent aldehyde dehydrogenase